MKASKEKQGPVDSTKSTEAEAKALDAEALLKADHRKVEELFANFEKAEASTEKARIAKEVCGELIVHTMLEEEIFYPECREKGVEDDLLDEAQVEHDGAKVLITELLHGEPDDAFFDAKVSVLSEYIKHHVGEEEKTSEGIFAKARKAGLDMDELGQRLQARKQQLEAEKERIGSTPPKPRSIHAMMQSEKENTNMARQSYNSPERDERGRFVSDDDYDRPSRSRGRYSEEDTRYSRRRDDSDDDRRGHGGWFGDPEGHSQAARSRYDDDDRRSSRSRSRHDDDDDYDRRGGRGHSGWYGDPEGHSRAARSRYDDDDRRSSYSRGRGGDYDDDNGRGQGGWFGDPEGHSRASERGWDSRRGSSRGGRDHDDDDGRSRGQGGWFGDAEGHSRASERGWDSRRGSSRGGRNYDDDDDRGRGHGGWFGDSRGHADAARRAWRNRD